MMGQFMRGLIKNNLPFKSGPVLYWMGRDQRIDDNWALIEAYQAANGRNEQLKVFFNLPKSYGQGTLRQYDFLIEGLKEVEQRCIELGIGFYLTEGEVVNNVIAFCKDNKVGELYADFNPLKQTRQWHETVYQKLSVRAVEIDTHNIVPYFIASKKEEFAAYTFRPRIKSHLSIYLSDFPRLSKLDNAVLSKGVDWSEVKNRLRLDSSVPVVNWLKPGVSAAKKTLRNFINKKLDGYSDGRNDPNLSFQSQLSPYLHFGQISAQRVALEVMKSNASTKDKEAFLEELIVRKELADNYCYYNTNYDNISGAHAWAQKTISEHAGDVRQYIYTKQQFEESKTHDDLWNAMQNQLTTEGKLHGWCRMYWAKKILEWTPDIETALDVALHLNDKYSLDGNDPNGFTGVMWSICGVHDRAWNERPIFGKIRYMNYAGAKRKFKITDYINKYTIRSLF